MPKPCPEADTIKALVVASAKVRRLTGDLAAATAARNALMRKRREEGASLGTIARQAGLTKPAIVKALSKTEPGAPAA